MTDIAIVDYGMGNLRSVAKALEHVAPEAVIAVTNNPEVVRKAERVVVPGQGAMPDCLRELDRLGLREAVRDAAANKPFLGICIGLQMLFDSSEEGNVSGLGIVPGRVKRFPASAMKDEKGQKLKVPHMGWNQVHQSVGHSLWKNIANDSRFYFVHSYYVEPADADSAGHSAYPFSFTCAVAKDNIFAVQFHPEKSHAAGLTLLGNFVRWKPV
ncbi:imidazole glycerol phosphate synthase subunit HisH [Nitrosospira multiformis]|uniref:Imidazole glycerol phosphate synthase subunit HisH n=2 Tax=Nitrosospira multiformis (strain ATCC 25196 / NCIMB 11849 / C 71) TaxID=323848 RepID=HIS5_NITMU|nr:imidazole glycerol phosphate synthase subunit HisH [Nitrosospira multiformis]Q2YAU8.1 RecName: Full=Imidazole glycerol phosphate synthase subunit HisH; AltName: Full=IGP synthase glutaminase subunit; AltName: Full=IGP synthase subunit HisH; AltName: Full=ImGP synthase subunit HisH; Short=IGPS subunit HisH [Nitrosospira multiformis ATCC 25196]ABB74123.1 imidazole glycerol phosphate synthase subunit hisH [Nitrosospira multiformis ATCC 25196]SEA74604.1 imidazole glycerol phosphate synthase subun